MLPDSVGSNHRTAFFETVLRHQHQRDRGSLVAIPMSYCNHFRDFLVLSSADLTRLTLVDLDFVPAPGCQQKIRVLLRLQKLFKKAPEVFRKRIVLSSSLFGAVSKSKQRHRITHEALMAANPTKTFSCFFGGLFSTSMGGAFCFFFC